MDSYLSHLHYSRDHHSLWRLEDEQATMVAFLSFFHGWLYGHAADGILPIAGLHCLATQMDAPTLSSDQDCLFFVQLETISLDLYFL